MPTVNDILKVARAEIGYREGSNNSNKYGAEYGLDHQPWCVIFIWWIFKHSNASSLFYGGGKIALCSALFNYHKGKGQSVSRSSLKAGDVVFFDFSGKATNTSHVGIVEKINSDGSITTIEGNTSSGSSGSQSNGDGVYRRVRPLKYVSKAYRPAYEGAESIKKCTVELPELENGCKGEAVKSLQVLLNYKLNAGLTVDGDFGDLTEKAVKQIEPDGIIGKNGWTKLIG